MQSSLKEVLKVFFQIPWGDADEVIAVFEIFDHPVEAGNSPEAVNRENVDVGQMFRNLLKQSSKAMMMPYSDCGQVAAGSRGLGNHRN